MLNTPVLFLVFNRPDTTIQVFEQIRCAAPRQLFIAADGPRSNHLRDAEKCEQVKNIVSNVDWDCEVKTLFRDQNLGCSQAVSQAITWFFKNVEEGIILEDDTIPEQSFFYYCSELLNHYRTENKIMHISGTNFQFGRKRGCASYYFSNYFHVWGWASWRRAWNLYDFNFEGLNNFVKANAIKKNIKTKSEQAYWLRIFANARNGLINTWDYQWLFSIWLNEGISITPNVNMISNIGLGTQATHTSNDIHLFRLATGSISKIIHLSDLQINKKADLFTYNKAINCKPRLITRVRTRISFFMPLYIKNTIKKII